MSVLDHRLLRQLLAVAKFGTVRAAARSLHMSQPPLTAAIRLLEQRLGVQLFERSVKGMRLTEAGEALMEEAASILGRLERAEARVLAIGGRERPIRIGFVSAALNGPLPALLRGLGTARKPSPRLTEMTTPEQIEALIDGRIDVGLLHPPVPPIPEFDSISLGRDPFWAALPSTHRLADRASLLFKEIAGDPFVLFPEAQGPALHERICSLIRAHEDHVTIAAEASRIHSQLAMISGGIGVGLITKSTAMTLDFKGVTAIALQDTQNQLFLELSLLAEPELAQSLSGTIRSQHTDSADG